MTTKEISDRILARLDDDPTSPGSVTIDPNSPVPLEILAAIAEGQDLAAWLSLCFEATAPITLVANGVFYALRATFPDFLVPLRLTTTAGRVRPTTLAALDARDDAWQSHPGTPAYYFTLGFNFCGISPQPITDTTAQLTYARSPAPLVGDAWPELPEAYHPALEDYAIYKVKLKEGAQGLQRGLVHLNRFLDEITKLGEYVRAKSRAARYDVLPFELALFDRSKLVDEISKGKKPWSKSA